MKQPYFFFNHSINFVVTLKPEQESKPLKPGVGKGRFKAPDDLDANEDEAIAMLMESALP